MGAFKDLTGQKFGRLAVIERAESKNGFTRWLCKCECGKETVVYSSTLINGHTKSCGCLRRDNHANLEHGMSHTRIHDIWCGINKRCDNPKSSVYKYYGGKGITICNEWRSFQSFYDWSMANGYNDDLTLDRIDPKGNYEPSNCRWVTMKEQCNNKANCHRLTYNGKTQTLSQWADEYEMKYSTLYNRVITNNWTIEKALNTP